MVCQSYAQRFYSKGIIISAPAYKEDKIVLLV